MAKPNKKFRLFDKIAEHYSDMIFGILSGSGLFFIVNALSILITIIIPSLIAFYFIIFIVLYLFILISTSILYTRGWFRIIYLTSALILLATYIYMRIFGAII